MVEPRKLWLLINWLDRYVCNTKYRVIPKKKFSTGPRFDPFFFSPDQQLTTAQLIPHAQVQHIAQSATVAGTSGTQLVKTVSAPVGGVQIPVSSVNINVSVPQQKGVVGEYQ